MIRLAGDERALGPWGAALGGIREALERNGVEAGFLPAADAHAFMANMDDLEARMAAGERIDAVNEAGLLTVDRAEADVCVNFREQVDWAYRGVGCHARHRHGRLRALCRIVQPQYVGIAATRESGITSLEQVARERRPVRVATVSKLGNANPTRMMGFVTSRIFELSGFTQRDIVEWGGTVHGNREGLDAIGRGAIDLIAIPAYAGWGPAWAWHWATAQVKLELRFLAVPDAVRDRMCAELGLRKGVLPRGTFRGVDEDVPTFRMADHVVITHAGLDADDATAIVRAIDEHPDALQLRYVQHAYDARSAWRDTGAPLHDGAAAYYKERGYLA